MSSDEPIPYSRRAIVGAGSIGLVATAALAFAQSSKETPLSKQSETPAPEGLKTREPNIRSPLFADSSNRGPDSQAGWIRAQTTARRHTAGLVGSPAARPW
jgi:hypothetical protein